MVIYCHSTVITELNNTECGITMEWLQNTMVKMLITLSPNPLIKTGTQLVQLVSHGLCRITNKLINISHFCLSLTREYYREKYHCTVDLLLDWFGLVCFANKNKNCHLSYSCFQTGGQWYSDTSPFSIFWSNICQQCGASTVKCRGRKAWNMTLLNDKLII